MRRDCMRGTERPCQRCEQVVHVAVLRREPRAETLSDVAITSTISARAKREDCA